jgi:hypothetical protein
VYKVSKWVALKIPPLCFPPAVPSGAEVELRLQWEQKASAD